MAVDLIATDAMFPDYRPGMDTDAYLRENNNYLFLLKESLNYTLHNLGVANFNARQFQTISDIITKPIMMALVGDEGQITSIRADLEGIKTTVGTVEGNVSTIRQTVKGLSTRVTSVEGKYSSLEQTVSGFQTTVTNISGDYISKSSATQSASGFKFEVMDSNHSNALVTLDSSGLTIKGGGILIKNSTNQAVLKADTNGNLTLTGTVDSSAIFGSTIATCSKEDYYASANGASSTQFIQIADATIKSFMGNSLYGFEAAAIGTSSYFGLNYADIMRFRVQYDTNGYFTSITGEALHIGDSTGAWWINIFDSQITLDSMSNTSLSLQPAGIYMWTSGSVTISANGGFVVNGTTLA